MHEGPVKIERIAADQAQRWVVPAVTIRYRFIFEYNLWVHDRHIHPCGCVHIRAGACASVRERAHPCVCVRIRACVRVLLLTVCGE